MVDYTLIHKLLQIAHAAAPPDNIGEGEFADLTFDSMDRWQVAIFYDCGELDYIDHFISPTGEKIDLWGDKVDPRVDDSGDGCFGTLHNWRGCGDTERLLAGLPSPA